MMRPLDKNSDIFTGKILCSSLQHKLAFFTFSPFSMFPNEVFYKKKKKEITTSIHR